MSLYEIITPAARRRPHTLVTVILAEVPGCRGRGGGARRSRHSAKITAAPAADGPYQSRVQSCLVGETVTETHHSGAGDDRGHPGASSAVRAVDSDVDLRVPRQRFELRRAPWATLAVISAGGVIGALARYGLTEPFPHRPVGFDWAVFGANVSGCLLIGVLMVAVTEVWQVHRLARPFLGVGVLGGFTTFSTYIIDIQQAVSAGAAWQALGYLAATLVCALAAVYAGVRVTRVLTRPHYRDRRDREDVP
jgi:CrcB protein